MNIDMYNDCFINKEIRIHFNSLIYKCKYITVYYKCIYEKHFLKMEDIIPSFCLNYSRSCCSTEKIQFPHRVSRSFLIWYSCSFLTSSLCLPPGFTGSRHSPFPSVHEHTQKIPVVVFATCLTDCSSRQTPDLRFWKLFIVLVCVWIVSSLGTSLIPWFSSNIVFPHYPTGGEITRGFLRCPYFLTSPFCRLQCKVLERSAMAFISPYFLRT